MATPNSCPGKSARRCERDSPMKTALLFDLDGTLVDTDALHLTARPHSADFVSLDRAFVRHAKRAGVKAVDFLR